MTRCGNAHLQQIVALEFDRHKNRNSRGVSTGTAVAAVRAVGSVRAIAARPPGEGLFGSVEPSLPLLPLVPSWPLLPSTPGFPEKLVAKAMS